MCYDGISYDFMCLPSVVAIMIYSSFQKISLFIRTLTDIYIFHILGLEHILPIISCD
jgi:hypothetical protein